MIEYLDTALLAGIFWRMGVIQEALKAIRSALRNHSNRLNKLEGETA